MGGEQHLRLGLGTVFKGACAVFYQECTPQARPSPDLFPRGNAALWTESLSILSVMVHRTGKPPLQILVVGAAGKLLLARWNIHTIMQRNVETLQRLFQVCSSLNYCLGMLSFLPHRYALICQQCLSHNGMALKEEFEYTGKTW